MSSAEAFPEMIPLIGYVVVHEWDLGGKTQYGTTGSIWPSRESAENHLGYCQAMQERDHPGSEGRYFIAAVYDDTAAEEATDA